MESDPADFVNGLLDSLTTLDASLNRITSVEGLCSLLRLQRLFLRGNNLSSIPSCIGQLSHLTRFSAASNHIGVVPDSIGNIRCLRDLYLDGNEITALPESIGNATNLEQLFVNNNRLVILPNKIGQLAKLRDLNVSGNKLKVLPSSLNNLIGLKSLSLEGNDGLGMPADVLIPNRPTAILDYYVRIRSAKRPLNEAKLILVGLGEVGKTSLVNKLIYGTFDENQKETEGVNITDWKVQLRNGEDVRLHVWDFAGQEIKHATHQFFLTKRSLYMLVLNGRQGKEDEDAEYWLSLINSFAEDSPVIVVLNKIRAHPFTVNSRGLQAKFTNVRAFVETDCQDGTGIDDLKAVILGETDRLPDLRKLFPEAWFAIKERLAGMKENFLTFANYREICIANGENDAKAQEDLTFHLHNLGLVLNYGEDARLRDNTVLNPRWVTDGIYKILNAEWLRESKGELRLADIAKILDSEMYPANRHGFLIELMRRFELCFRFTDEDDHYLIADLLDKQEPLETKDFKPSHCLNLALFSKAMHRDRLPLNQ